MINLGEMVRDNRYISIQLQLCGNRALSEQGLTDVQARVLLYIMANSETGTSLTDIHRELHFSMAAASGLIKRLREKGFVRVEGCKLDERRKLLYVTEKGARVREVMDASLKRLPDLLYRDFTAEELETLNRLQKKMICNLSLSEKES